MYKRNVVKIKLILRSKSLSENEAFYKKTQKNQPLRKFSLSKLVPPTK